MRQLLPADLDHWLRRGAQAPDAPEPLLLDVREPWEVAIAALPGSLNIPMGEIPARLDELDGGRPVICICHHGVRSMHVARFLAMQGLDPIFNLAGGMDAWAREVDPNCPTY